VAANTSTVGASALNSIQTEIQARLTVRGSRRPHTSPAQPAAMAPTGMPSAVMLPSNPRVAGVAPHGA
jgi:hypothetical protein